MSESMGEPEVLMPSTRPVMDVAESQKRRQDIISAVSVVLAAIPALVLAFNADLLSAAAVAGITVFLGVLSGAAMVIYGRKDLATAFHVESQVTPTANPRDDAGNVLSPGPMGSDNSDELPDIPEDFDSLPPI